MKGVVLAGGLGTRLHPLTKGVNKHLLPIYDEPMIHYPIKSLVEAGITDIMVVTGGEHANQFVNVLGDGTDLGCTIVYAYQTKPGGIAEALSLAQTFVGDDRVCVILGDNIFEDSIRPFKEEFEKQDGGCHLVCKPVSNPCDYGVLEDSTPGCPGKYHIVEKPLHPSCNLAITGLYFYTPIVFFNIMELTPSERGEIEVSDLNNIYAEADVVEYSMVKNKWWDCGVDIDHMLQVANEVKEMKDA